MTSRIHFRFFTGLTVTFNNQTVEVCRAGKILSEELSSGQTARLSLWHVPSADFEFSCYAWCTKNGRLPKKPSTKAELKNIANQTVNWRYVNVDTNFGYKELNLLFAMIQISTKISVRSLGENNSENLILSPLLVYKLNTTLDELNLRWIGTEVCKVIIFFF